MPEVIARPEQELKTAFAEALLRSPDDPHTAACAVIGDFGLAMQAAILWVKDPFVIGEKERLTKLHGAKAFLPSKEDQARDVYRLAKDEKLDVDDRLKAHRLFAEIMNHIDKAPPVAIQVTQGVMIVKDHGSDADWEQKAIAQQQTLIATAKTNVA